MVTIKEDYPTVAESPYIRGRFLIDGIVKAIAKKRKQLQFRPNIYVEKKGKLIPPYIFIWTLESKLKPLNHYWMMEHYLMCINSRIRWSETTYQELEDIKCLLYDCLEWVELPMANSTYEGKQPLGMVKPVKGYDFKHLIETTDDYAELYTYLRYDLQIFRELPITVKMRTQKVREKLRDIPVKGRSSDKKKGDGQD